MRRSEAWVNAVIVLTIPLDGVSVDDGAYAKSDAVARVASRVHESLPDDLQSCVSTGRWEDASDA